MINFGSMRALLSEQPSIVQNAPLTGQWEVVVPIARTNEITNPSMETNITGYTAGAGTLSRDTTKQYHGAYSAKYVPSAAINDGFFYGNIATTLGQVRALSCKWWGQPNVKYAFTLATTAGVDAVTFPFLGLGRWVWTCFYFQETSSQNRRLYFRKNGSTDVHPFWVDGVQSEVINAGELVSTYIDGDQQGFLSNQFPVPYGWNGTPHASTSFRLLQTRAGGYVIPFKKYGFVLLAMLGLGLPQVQNVNTDYAQVDGGNPNFTHKPISQFSIVGNVPGTTYGRLRSNRSQLGQLFDRDFSALDQQLLLRYTHIDDCNNIDSDTIEIPCKYVTGWEGQTDNPYSQNITMTFETYLPSISSSAETGSSLAVQQNVSNANYIESLDIASGVWSAVSSGTVAGASGDVNAIVIGQDGKVYIGGVFATASGVVNTSKIAYYDPTDGLFHAMGTGATGGNVNFMVIGSDGVLYAVGSFTSMGGVANTNNIAKWNGSAWSALGTGVTSGSGILCIAIDSQNNIYVGGTFALMGGVANTLRIAKWNGSAWSAIGTGANDIVRSLDVGPGDVLYIGGDFTTVNGTSAIRVASWNGTAISALGTGMDSSVFALTTGLNNVLYAGGDFTTAGGVTATRTAMWNGSQWQSMGSGLNTTVRVLSLMPDGTIWAGGGFTNSGGVSLRSPMARWNGASWIGSDNNLVGTVTVQAITPDRNGKLYVGFSSFGTANQAGITTVINPGTARSYPSITIYGPTSGTGRIYTLRNNTTGRNVELNIVLNVGEIIQLSFQPDNLSFVSNFRGNIDNVILSGSNEADFFLSSGSNSFAVLSASTTVVAVIYFHTEYLSMDDVQ